MCALSAFFFSGSLFNTSVHPISQTRGVIYVSNASIQKRQKSFFSLKLAFHSSKDGGLCVRRCNPKLGAFAMIMAQRLATWERFAYSSRTSENVCNFPRTFRVILYSRWGPRFPLLVVRCAFERMCKLEIPVDAKCVGWLTGKQRGNILTSRPAVVA